MNELYGKLYKTITAFMCTLYAVFAFVAPYAALTAVALPVLASCSKNDGSGYTFKYDISNNPRTLDPQTATESEAALVITNVFEGLLKLDDNGGVVAGVAMEYEVSADGLTYIFHLRDDVYWDIKESGDDGSNGDGNGYVKCNADDFVFAFRRLFNPLIKSPVAPSYFCIKNAEAAYNKIVDVTEAGVSAPDKSTVIITLEYPNPNLPALLTDPPAMPCNEAFYLSTKGRYGLSDTSLAGNGAVRLHSWYYDPHSNVDNHFILRRNVANAAVTPVKPYGLNFFIDDTDSLENFANGVSNSIVADGDNADVLISHDYPYTAYENAVWGLKFNPRGAFADKDARLALAQTIDRSAADAAVHAGIRAASLLIPDIIRVGNEFYHEGVSGESYIAYDPVGAKTRLKGIDAGGTTDVITIISPEGDVCADYLGRVTQEWQEKLGFFCKVAVLPDSEYNAAVLAGKYDIALVKYTAEWNSPSAIMRGIIAGYGGDGADGGDGGDGADSGDGGDSSDNADADNTADYTNITALLTAAERAANAGESFDKYKAAEKAIINTAIFIPLYFKTEYFFTDKDSSGIEYNPFSKTITYRNAIHGK